jgi:hypothetical protein
LKNKNSCVFLDNRSYFLYISLLFFTFRFSFKYLCRSNIDALNFLFACSIVIFDILGSVSIDFLKMSGFKSQFLASSYI